MSADIFFLYMTHWGEFALRWLHVITAIAWVGSSFYFIALDLGLRQAPQLPKESAKKNTRRGMASAWGRVLSYPKIPRRPA